MRTLRLVLVAAVVAIAGAVLSGQAQHVVTTASKLITGTGLADVTDGDGAPVARLNVAGAPTLSTCGDGALQTGSSNTSGRVVGTTQTACTLTFSVSFGGNSADCFIENLTANRGNVTAASATAFTVSTLTAGDDFMYWCVGR
jgi:hypothetical protein